MSNRALRDRISTVLASYRAGTAKLSDLKDAVEQNGEAMEAMPDALARELRHFEYLFTVAQFSDEDSSLPSIDSVLAKLDLWLNSVPVDV